MPVDDLAASLARSVGIGGPVCGVLANLLPDIAPSCLSCRSVKHMSSASSAMCNGRVVEPVVGMTNGSQGGMLLGKACACT
eukprot:3248131-Amphidinium_carterae.1